MNNIKKLYCCDKEAVFIDMGPKLQYYFCKACRREVVEPIKFEAKPLSSHSGGPLIPKEEDMWDLFYGQID